MKLLFTIGSLAGGGAERVVSTLASSMSRKGHVVEIVLISNNKIDYKVNNEVIVKYINPKIQVRGLRYLFRCKEYRKEVKRFNPDVIISFTTAVNLFVYDAMRGNNHKIVFSERNDPYNDPKEIKLRDKRDRVYSKVDGIVFQTEDAQSYFNQEVQKNSVIILNPVEISNELLKPKIKCDKIVSVGRLEEQKNHAMLIKAFSKIHKQFPKCRLEIYGEGSLRDELEKLIKSKNLENVVFLKGYTTNVIEAISTAKIFVLSSNYEGMSNALIEAMAIGLPVISTDHPIGGARMLIKDGLNGLLVPINDYNAIANAILKILKDEKLAQKLSENAVCINETLNVDRITEQWLDYIQNVIGC